jgi:hypothetical protein
MKNPFQKIHTKGTSKIGSKKSKEENEMSTLPWKALYEIVNLTETGNLTATERRIRDTAQKAIKDQQDEQETSRETPKPTRVQEFIVLVTTQFGVETECEEDREALTPKAFGRKFARSILDYMRDVDIDADCNISMKPVRVEVEKVDVIKDKVETKRRYGAPYKGKLLKGGK